MNCKRSLLSLVAVFCLLAIVACAQDAAVSREPSPEPAAFGVIETREILHTSRAIFFDESLELAGTLEFAEGSMGDYFCDACMCDDVMYAGAIGLGNEKTGKDVYGLDLSDVETKVYTMPNTPLGVAASKRYVYGYGNLNGDSYIDAYDTTSGKTRTLGVPGRYISLLMCAEGRLFSFNSPMWDGSGSSKLTVYDEGLNQQREYDLGVYGMSVFRAAVCNGMLYFPYELTNDEGVASEQGFCSLDLETGDLNAARLERPFPSGILVHGDKLYISHQDLVANENNGKGWLSIYNVKTGDVQVKELPCGPYQMATRGDEVAFLDIASRKLCVCDIDTLELKKSVDLPEWEGEYSFLTNLFAVPPATL